MDRRAFASLNCITVVPGAVGAWRKDLLIEAVGFASDTLTEDQDLTLRIRRLGYTIGYEETAIAWSEAPHNVRALAKQRFRWAYGTLQCMWKHRDALFRPRYGALGFVAMPNVWIFQILFSLISPVMDLMLLVRSDRGGIGPLATTNGLHVHEPRAGTLLLRAVPGRRLDISVHCVSTRTSRTLVAVVVVVSTAVLLPAGAVLRDD